jgi:hypothetical protein
MKKCTSESHSKGICDNFQTYYRSNSNFFSGTLLLMDIVQHKLECQTKCAFVPNFLKLHPDQGLFIAANDKGLIQCFDIALSPIRYFLFFYLRMADI